MDESDSDGIADLLVEDNDDLDDQLFGLSKKQKDNKPSVRTDESSNKKKTEKKTAFMSSLFPEPNDQKKNSNDIYSSLSTSQKKPTSTMNDLFGPINRSADTKRTRPGNVEVSWDLQGSSPSQASRPTRPDLPSYSSGADDLKQSAKEAVIEKDSTSHLYDRSRRLENEVDRLNREIDDIKLTKKRDEEELINEWKQKLAKKQKEFDETLTETCQDYRKQIDRLKEDHNQNLINLKETFNSQLEAIQTVQQHTKEASEVLQKVEALTSHIGQISSKVSDETERNIVEREAKVAEKERFLTLKEQRLTKDEQKLLEERKFVDNLNLKLRSLCDEKEAIILKEKWLVQEEKNKLRAEKMAFKEEQKSILGAIEREKVEVEESRKRFLNEQHDLLVRVINEKLLLNDEKSTFVTQRNSDIARIKDEAQRLDIKIIEVENAERLLSEARRMYEIKYRMLIEFEQSLTDECKELDECRKQLENAKRIQNISEQVPFWTENKANITDEKPRLEIVADPYILPKSFKRSENAKALSKLCSFPEKPEFLEVKDKPEES